MRLPIGLVGIVWSLFFSASLLQAYPKIKALSVSTFTLFDYWESDSFAWRKSSNSPALVAGIKFGGALQFSKYIGLFASLPIQYSRSGSDSLVWPESFVQSGNPLDPISWARVKKSSESTTYIGDLELGTGFVLNPWQFKFHYWLPTGYVPKQKRFIQTRDTVPEVGVEYSSPWKGFGVHRVGGGAAYAKGVHYAQLQAMWVVYKPGGEKAGLVEVGDLSFSALYSKAAKLSARWTMKPMVESKFSNFHWEGPDEKNRREIELNALAGLSYSPFNRHYFSISSKLGVWSRAWEPDSDGEMVATPSSRKISMGASYGVYF